MPSGAAHPIIDLDQVPIDAAHARHLQSAQHDDAPHSPARHDDYAAIAAPLQPPLLASDDVRALNAAKRAKGKARASGSGKAAGVNGKIAGAHEGAGNDDSDDSSAGDPDALIHALPAEVLMRVLAYLDPDSILSCTLVCRSFSALARDEATWRLAFSIAFNIEAADLELSEAAPTPPGATALRRVNRTSWKLEYTTRSELLRRWRKSRSPTVLSDPRIAALHSIAVAHPHHFMLSASLTYGVASRSDPFTGKVSKGFIDAAGQINGAGIGNPNAEFAPDATAVAIEADASRIVWGFRGGEVNMTTLSRQGTNPRGMIKSHRFSPRGGHPGGVTDIALPFPTGNGGVHSAGRSTDKVRAKQAALGDVGEAFVTAGVDGTVRLWSPKRPLPLWIDTVRPPAPSDADPTIHAARNRPPPVVCVVYDVASGSVAAGTSEGTVVAWSGIDAAGLLGLPAEAWETNLAAVAELDTKAQQAQAERAQILATVRRADIQAPERIRPEQDPAVVQLELDYDTRKPSSLEGLAQSAASAPSHLTLLARHVDHASFQRHDVTWPSQHQPPTLRTTTFVAPGHTNEISALRIDFDTTLPADLPASRDPSQPPSRLSPRLSAQPDHDSPRPDGAPGVLSLSSSQVRVAPTFGPSTLMERKYVCAGTKLGGLYLWDWSAGYVTGDQVPTAPPVNIAPMITFEGHTTAVTSIDTAAHVLVAGFSDGTVKAFCALTGRLIRTLNDRTASRHPARMLAAGQLTADEAARFTVRQVIVREDSLIAAIGHQVLAWKAEALRPKGRKSKDKGGQRTPSSVRNWDSKFQARVDLRQDLNDVSVQLESDREKRQAAYDQLRKTVGGGSSDTAGGLTEDEQLEYAIMLSRDEEAERARRGSGTILGKGKGKETATTTMATLDDEAELEQALVQIALAETSTESGSAAISSRSSAVEEDDLYGDESTYDESLDMASPSPSPGPSPSLRGVSSPSRAWDIIRNAGPHGATWNAADDRYRPNSKVRTVKVSRAARMSSSHQSGTGTISGGENGPLTPPGLDSAAQWPSFSPSSQSPGPEAWNLDAPSGKARSSWSRSPSLHPLGGGAGSLSGIAALGTSPGSGSAGQSRVMGAWAAGSPSSRSAAPTPPRGVSSSNTTTTPGSLLSSSRPGAALHQHGGQQRRSSRTTSGFSPSSPGIGGSGSGLQADGEMDDDLRFAIELSLAEERSRKKSQAKQG